MISGRGASSRKAMALWAVLILLVLAMLMVSGLVFFSRSGMKQADRIVSYAEHLYRAEAVFARCLHRLRAATWEKRFYATGGSPSAFASTHETGVYRDAEYHLFCQDVRGKTGKVLPGFVDVIVKIVHEGTSRDYVSRVRIRCEESGAGGDDEAVRFVRATEELVDEDGRRRAVARLDAEEEEREANRARTDALVRSFQRAVHRDSLPSAELVKRLEGAEKGKIDGEAAWLQEAMGRLREAMACLGKAGIDLLDAVFTLNGYNLDVQLEDANPDFAQAVRKLQDMLGWIGAPDDEMRAEYRRLALFLLGRVCRLWADQAPGGKARLEEGEESLKKLLDEAEETRTRFIGPRSPEGDGEGEEDDVRPDDVFMGRGTPSERTPLDPYALLERARILARLAPVDFGAKGRLNETLGKLEKDFGRFRPHGGEKSMKEKKPKDPKGKMRKELAEEAAAAPPPVIPTVDPCAPTNPCPPPGSGASGGDEDEDGPDGDGPGQFGPGNGAPGGCPPPQACP